jgi:transcriptional regulator with XRE-family HTH domain
MNERLLQFLRAENITQSQFADNIGVARASISHIVSGRNKPGFDFLENTARHYPALNIGWLITGKGRMYSSQSTERQEESTVFDRAQDEGQIPYSSPASGSPETRITESNNSGRLNKSAENKRFIEKILVFYSDNSFEEYHSAGPRP